MNATDPFPAVAPLPAALLSALKAEFAERCSTALAVREQHGRDESVFDVSPPQAVVFAESEAEVARVVALCAQHRVPVIPYGAGSSLEGHLLAVQGGVSLDVSRMNRILRIDAEDLTATVQPGVTRKALNDALRHEGLFFPIDPGADATAPCARTCWGCASSAPAAKSCAPARGRRRAARATT
jgi:D-lactate dehydrogenase (cytochrome)